MQATIGGRCRLARKEANLTQDELAEALGVSQRTVVRYEGNQQEAPASYVAGVAKITGADPGYLLAGTDSPAHAKLEKIREILDQPIKGAPEDPAFDAPAVARASERLLRPKKRGRGSGGG